MKQSGMILSVAVALLFSACSKNGGPNAPSGTEHGSINFLCYLDVSALAKTVAADSLELEMIISTLSNTDTSYLDTSYLNKGDSVDIEWDSLNPGEWEVRVRSISFSGVVVHDSAETVSVEAGQHQHIVWNLTPKKSRFNLKVNPDSVPGYVDMVKLYLDSVLVDSGQWTGDTLSLTSIVDVNQTYDVLVVFLDDNLLNVGEASGSITPDPFQPTVANFQVSWEDPGDQDKHGSLSVTITLTAPSNTTVIVETQ